MGIKLSNSEMNVHPPKDSGQLDGDATVLGVLGGSTCILGGTRLLTIVWN